MTVRIRAASFAATLFCAFAIAGLTSPGLAQDIHSSSIATLNAIAQPQVPLAAAIEGHIQADSPAPQMRTVQTPLASDVPAADLKPAVVQDTDDQDFSTLAEAVAAQSTAAEDRELECLAAGVFYESHGEPLAGQLAVAQTILNRARSGRFPKSVCGVLTQPGQFSFVRGGTVPSAEGRRGWSTAVAVAKVAYRDLWDDVAPKALYFHASRVSPGWRMTRIATVGNHIFYR